jgi:hypothetical protein
VLALGCDTGHKVLEPTKGPPLRVVSTYPADGAGFDCAIDDPGCGVPINTSIELRFDRFLLPTTAIRQSLAIYVGDDPSNLVPPPGQFAQLTPRYDLVERVVSYELPSGTLLRSNTLYTVALSVPTPDEDFGFRAFDGAELDPDTPLSVSFLTSNQAEMLPPGDPSATCTDVLQTFNRSCVGGSCHGTSGHVMGMNLSTADALSQTAVGRVAHQAETGPTTGRPTENPARFGVAMPRIDPGRPDNSYLMYKLLAAPENYRFRATNPDLCGSRHRAPPDPVNCVPATADEVERLREWFLRGVAMPRPKDTEDEPSWLGRGDLLGIDSWIAAGAACP